MSNGYNAHTYQIASTAYPVPVHPRTDSIVTLLPEVSDSIRVEEFVDVTTQSMVHYLTKGWKVVHTYTNKWTESKSEYDSTGKYVTEYIQHVETRAVLSRTNLERLREVERSFVDLEKRLESNVIALSQARKEREDAEKKFQEMEKKAKKLEEDYKSQQLVVTDHNSARVSAVTKAKDLETQLSKVRNAIGELQMQKILSTP